MKQPLHRCNGYYYPTLDHIPMSLLARLILLLQERNQIKCTRCGLYHHKQHTRCPHCRDMDEARLQAFLEESGIDPEAKSGLGQFLVLAAIIVVVIYLLSRILR